MLGWPEPPAGVLDCSEPPAAEWLGSPEPPATERIGSLDPLAAEAGCPEPPATGVPGCPELREFPLPRELLEAREPDLADPPPCFFLIFDFSIVQVMVLNSDIGVADWGEGELEGLSGSTSVPAP